MTKSGYPVMLGKGEALVCFRSAADPTEIVPVRFAQIAAVNVHGSTRSLDLQIGEFAYVEDPSVCAQQISEMVPADETSKMVFNVAGPPAACVGGKDLLVFEKCVKALAKTAAFRDTKLFFTVLGLFKAWKKNRKIDPVTKFSSRIAPNEDHDLLVYRYHPDETDNTPYGELKLHCGGAIEEAGPTKLVADSRYNLDAWRIHSASTNWDPKNGWLRLGPSGEWQLDIDVGVRGQKSRSLISLFLIAVSFMTPGLVAKLGQPTASTLDIIVTALVGFLMGLLAGSAMLFGIQRVRPPKT